MESLPLALQREICSFAAAPELIPLDIDTSDINHSAPNFATHLTEPSTLNLQRLARVCRAWRDIVAEFCAEHEATRVMTLQFTTGHEREQEKRINKLFIPGNNGEKLLDLRIIITAEKRVLWWDLDAETQTPTPGQAEDLLQWVEWNLLTTSTYCKHLEALILPKKYKLHADAVADNVDFVLWRLYLALEKWHEASGGNGLRQLTVPSRSEFDREMASNEFLTTVLRFCPRLEYLDGWKRSYSEGTRLVASDESLCVSRDVWKVFCKSCVMLREFSWVIVPFSDEFFLPFGQTTKPFLHVVQSRTFGRRSSSTAAVRCTDLPQIDEMIDPDVFNDEFFLALAANCHRLRSLRIRELGSLSNTLWRAPQLTYVDIQDVRCSASAILDCLSTDEGSLRALPTRSVIFRELGVCFGDVVQHVLDDLGKESTLPLAGPLTETPLVISLSSRRGYVFERSWLVEMQRAFQAKFTKGEMRFAVFSVKKDKDTTGTSFRSNTTRSVEQEVIAKILARAWIKGDVLRIGRLVLYTHESALDKHLRSILQSKTSHSSSWIVT
ncbi:Leucine-rich repeat domain, L domain-like [Phytophthora cactorum]|nr:Leucine-rich repeat domain, L domain-like [Phytophthora cactorum]